MIKSELISKRYAEAFLSYAKETIGLERGLDELQRAKRVIRDNPDLKEFLENLDITKAEKGAVVNAVLRHDFSDETRQFLKLLIAKKRINLFIDMAEYARIHYAHGPEMDALLKTSYPLSTEMIQRIKNALEKRMRNKLHMYVQLDADLAGGIYARIGNVVIDGSVKKRLEDIKDKLSALKVA